FEPGELLADRFEQGVVEFQAGGERETELELEVVEVVEEPAEAPLLTAAGPAAGVADGAAQQRRAAVEQLDLDLPALEVRLLPALAERLVEPQQPFERLDVLPLVVDQGVLEDQRQVTDRRGGEVGPDAAAELVAQPRQAVGVVRVPAAGPDG